MIKFRSRVGPARLLLAACLLGAGGLAGVEAASAQPARAAWADESRLAGALRQAVRADREIAAFYAARGYRSLWLAGGEIGDAVDQAYALIADAGFDGLDPDRYKLKALAAALRKAEGGSPKAMAQAEARLSRSFADYARDLRRPRLGDVVYLDRELAPSPPAPRAILEAAAAPSLAGFVSSMGWMHPFYAGLRQQLAELSVRGDASRAWVPAGPALKPGASGERVRLLRERLGLEPFGGFDAPVIRAVRDFQTAHGLPEDGVAGARTIAALNAGPADAEHVVRLNLERARVLPAASAGGRYILVDAAAARLWMYEDGRVRDTMKVVVGKPAEPTPMLAGLMRYAIVNPYWNIPPDLVRNRVAPLSPDKVPAYLKKMRYEVLSDWGPDARVVDPKTVDWAAVASGRNEVRVRQLPGGKNAMGRMKFMMPNDLGIYLHDTPERELFGEADRRFSSGCVRLEDAPRLARWLFGKPLAASSSAPEQKVDLAQPVPVYITYLTAAPAPGGLAFRADAYGRDAPARGRGGSRWRADR